MRHCSPFYLRLNHKRKAIQRNPGLRAELRAEEAGEEYWRVKPDHT